jgi:hypothetical protein
MKAFSNKAYAQGAGPPFAGETPEIMLRLFEQLEIHDEP